MHNAKRNVLGHSDFFFKLQMLHQWLSSREGFNIKWQHVLRTYLNNKKTYELVLNYCQTKSRVNFLEKKNLS
jgi:hypothetical protein